MAPSTFASAAAGNSNSSRAADSDWSRRPNGSTQTFQIRRSSAAPTNPTSHQRDGSASNPGVYVPPHLNSNRASLGAETRYSKDQLLQLYRNQQAQGQLEEHLSDLYVSGFEPSLTNGAATAVWGRRDDHAKESQPTADLCWERNGSVQPLGLTEMSEQEKEHFSTSVNSPLKPPTQTGKEGTPKDGLPRKSSISQAQNHAGTYGLASPTSARAGNRRRDASESYPFPNTSLASPGSSRFPREESNTATPPPALLRRRTDYKEGSQGTIADDKDKDKPAESSAPFGGLKRSTTGGLGAGAGGPSSPWSATPPSSAFSSMGAFGSFNLSSAPASASTPTDKRSGFGSLRGESRFKGLMGKESGEDLGKSIQEKGSAGSLNRPSDSEGSQHPVSWVEARSARLSKGSEPFPEEELRTGSAALLDDSPPQVQGGFGSSAAPLRQGSRDEPGFSAFGMTANAGFRDMMQGREHYQQHQTPQRDSTSGEPMSPTDTNPFQSPENEKSLPDELDDASDMHHGHLPGLGGFSDQASHGIPGLAGLGNFGRVPASFEAAASDRSQTSSTGPNRAFPSLGGFGGIPGLGGSAAWSATGQASTGTPTRDRGAFGGAFGESIFASGSELQSPTLAGLGGAGAFGSGTGTLGRSSKMGSLFPSAMQEQMRAGDLGRQEDQFGEGSDRGSTGMGTFGRGVFGANPPGNLGPARDTGSPFRTNRGSLEELLARGPEGASVAGESAFSAFTQAPSAGTAPSSAAQGILGSQRNSAQAPRGSGVASPASGQPPAAQQRTMVMPDRMMWIYRDPQGNQQGPFSGLEMHDWYKAGFFSPELLVKKLEDPEYEPLAQLIRRIGNSREPFLVPQIGIPHGPKPPPGGGWSNTAPLPGAASAQPPFASSFPSFGTTLTAEQQNALERRKQEEQYLMARQKEHLAQSQIAMRQSIQMQIQGGHPSMHSQQLHHHSSAQSLHSQPSFGSITSPSGYQPSPTQGPVPNTGAVPGFFDSSFRPAPPAGPLGPIGGASLDMLGNIREEGGDMASLMDRLNLGRGPQAASGGAGAPLGHPPQFDSDVHAQQVATMHNDRARLQLEAEQIALQQSQGQGDPAAAQEAADRLQQFQELRAQVDAEQAAFASKQQELEEQVQQMQEQEQAKVDAEIARRHGEKAAQEQKSTMPVPLDEPSLTEQVQKAASAKQTPSQSPWGKIDTVLPLPFPPPQSSSPMPAPVAQRKQNLADALNEGSRSRSQTPSLDTPSTSIAPWAKESTEAPKGPSLKEIQEAEAKKAAQQEAIETAARRAALEKELLAQANAPQPAPGLPSTAQWASSASPVTPSSATASVWGSKAPLGNKAPATGSTPKPKTLQQIQKEEEARKQRAAANTLSAVANVPAAAPPSSGKTYAGLAGKSVPAPAGPAVGGPWMTVGASGKVKTPIATVPSGPASLSRSVTGGVATTPTTARPSATLNRSVTGGAGTASSKADAMEEFKKWCTGELRPELKKGYDVTVIVEGLLNYPLDKETITEAVHDASHTLDSRHFAEEFIRRRKLADKGIVDPAAASAASPAQEVKSGGGWSEVAKKGPGGPQPQQQQQKDEGASFKYVAAKKKGGKR